eukprot:scaffold6514_cov21-Tisochrysis_lutea.AAC.2
MSAAGPKHFVLEGPVGTSEEGTSCADIGMPLWIRPASKNPNCSKMARKGTAQDVCVSEPCGVQVGGRLLQKLSDL